MESKQIRAIAITVSDTRTGADDIAGETLVECLHGIGAAVIERLIVTDDASEISRTLCESAQKANLVITTGGTGFAPRDNTPEATRSVIDREAPGLAELMRFETAKKTPLAMLSRGVCGIRGRCLIVNLPGSPKAVRECFEVLSPLLPHAINLIEGETKH